MKYIESLYTKLAVLGIEPKKQYKTRVFIINEIVNKLWFIKTVSKEPITWR